MPVGVYGRCDGPDCEEWKKLKTGVISETVPAGWASIKVEIPKLGLPPTGQYVFHSRRCFLDWATDTQPTEASDAQVDDTSS